MLSVKDVMSRSPIIPVISISSAQEMLYLANALIEGGIDIFEITLRTPQALDAIEAVAKEFPQALTGAGTVINTDTLKAVEDAGAMFAISPGLTHELATYERKIPLLPGVATASEIMSAMEYGVDAFKLFPASIVGGVDALKAFGGPFKDVMFCPTGGINSANAKEYLQLSNVACIGGTWIIPSELIRAKKFDEITRLTKEALKLLR